ncbi:MAG: 3-hydroxyanthranilate 3,4-dioxygenase [Saprospiraceae bacterium]|nr:3-hydroxyanthranilate 3,4-dioxygenase [Saprospiraceae bacterium]
MLPPINFKQWIDDHRHLLKPPVGNRVVYEDTDFIIMVVGGPNSRKDFHYNEGEEFFFQLEGDITLKVMEHGKQKDIKIREGEIFLLPPRVPHSPQRGANTVGLVVERKREETEIDSCIWFCESCGNELYKENFSLKNIVTELPLIMDSFYSSVEKRTCGKCSSVMEPPVLVG